MANILVIDDERSIRNTLKDILEFEGHTVDLASDGLEGLEMLPKKEYDIILSDIKMPKMDGLELLPKILELNSDVQVIMISGHGSIDNAVEAIKKGAYDFIEKPLDLNRLLITIKNALDKSNLVTETKTLRRKVTKGSEIIGESQAIGKVIEMTDKVASSDARVLITGPNGSGKELVARRLHDLSNRRQLAFVEVNCAAIPSELIESELFGHMKGSFTSAIKDKKGKFELANNGTLFLDEIGDMSLDAQSKVLRALQENKITPVGGEKEIKVNVRVIAATNKDLKKEMAENRFREDLYHRLSVIVIKVPSLDERKDDIPLLINYFIDNICSENGMSPKNISSQAIEELSRKAWPGNIRELRNAIERLIILSDSEITADDVKQYIQ